ncbi:prolyl oligopeptidase family serine peptidase [Luteimonas lutimaris]|uniref:Prolyl oligopeptidase family serine peptidase n=1 Tax=Luteimonas lutimaris TaxID=698645 RepID=A0ABP7MDJ8_9GAMM
MKRWCIAVFPAVFGLACACVQAAEPVPVEAFAQSDSVTSPRISPDGRHVAVSANLGEGNHAIVVYRIEGMQQTALLKLPRYEQPVDMHWASDTRLLVAKGRLVGSREKPVATGEIIATDFDGRHQLYVFGYQVRKTGMDRGFGVIEGFPPVRNGHFYMRHLAANSSRSMLYDMDAERGTSRLVADIGKQDMAFVLDPGGVPRFSFGTTDDNLYLLYQANAQGKDWQPASAGKSGGKFVPFAISADGSEVFATYSTDGGPAFLVRSDLAGARRTTLASDPFGSVGDVEWSTAHQPFAATIANGRPRSVYFDETSVAAQEHRQISSKFPDHYVTYVNHTADGNVTLLYAYSDRDPGTWYLFNRNKATIEPLLAARGSIDPARMGERRHIRFKASDGLELDGYLTLPAGVQAPRKLPMVLLPHGGPHVEGDQWAFDNDAQFLASRGYLVLQVNYRGSEGRGDAFERAGYRHWGTRVQDDLIDGVRWTIAQGYTDPDRICSYGASFGAYSAMMVAARAPELVKCAAGLSGLYDLASFATDSDTASTSYGRNYIARVLGNDRNEWRTSSPVHLAGQIKVPVLLAHGEIDKRTPYAQAVAMKKALESAGNAPEWMSVPGEAHGFYKDENNAAFYRRLEAFLARNIGTTKSP